MNLVTFLKERIVFECKTQLSLNLKTETHCFEFRNKEGENFTKKYFIRYFFAKRWSCPLKWCWFPSGTRVPPVFAGKPARERNLVRFSGVLAVSFCECRCFHPTKIASKKKVGKKAKGWKKFPGKNQDTVDDAISAVFCWRKDLPPIPRWHVFNEELLGMHSTFNCLAGLMT